MYFGFAFRVALILIPILLIGIVTTSFLSLHKFGQTFSNLLNSRFEFVTSEIRSDVENQMDLGLALENLEITEVLEAYALDDKQILTIEVFDEFGVVLYSSDSSSVGDLVPEEWISIWRLDTNGTSWTTQENDAVVVGTPVRNNLGQNVGSLVLRYSREYLDRSTAEQARRLLTVNSIAAGITIIIAFLGAMLLLNRTSRELKLMGQILDTISTAKLKDASLLRDADIKHPIYRRFIASVLATYKDIDATITRAREFDEGKEG